MHVKLNIQAS